MKRPMFFFAQGDCGCGSQSGNSVPRCPAPGAIVADDKYFQLLTAPEGQMLLVPIGSNTQAFFKREDGFRGFVFYQNGKVLGTAAPALTLPLLNPAVSNAYPAPAPFKYLMIGTGDPAAWQHMAAPTAGTYVLQAKNGSFTLEDAGSIPGIDEIGSSGLTTLKGGLPMLIDSGGGNYTLRRLAPADKRVVVGFVDTGTGETGYKALPPGEALEHPTIKATTIVQFRTIESLDGSGAAISGGFDQAATFGAGAIVDGVRLLYSPGSKRLYKAPAATLATTDVSTNSASTVPPTSYAPMPGGHGAGVSRVFSFPTVRIDFHAVISTNGNNTWVAVYRDGVLIKEFNFDVVSVISLACVDDTCPPGSHTYDVRWKKTSGTDAVVIGNSYLIVSSMG